MTEATGGTVEAVRRRWGGSLPRADARSRALEQKFPVQVYVPELTFESITNDRERDLIEAGEFGGRLRPGSGTCR